MSFDRISPSYMNLVGYLVAGKTLAEVPVDVITAVSAEGYDIDAIVARYGK